MMANFDSEEEDAGDGDPDPDPADPCAKIDNSPKVDKAVGVVAADEPAEL
jgi:hypothetical protein